MRMTDAHAGGSGEGDIEAPMRLSRDEMQRELEQREHLLQLKPAGRSEVEDGGATDQWRVYQEARHQLQSGERPARLLIQASAGTGKSFLLTTLYLWCLLNGYSGHYHDYHLRSSIFPGSLCE